MWVWKLPNLGSKPSLVGLLPRLGIYYCSPLVPPTKPIGDFTMTPFIIYTVNGLNQIYYKQNCSRCENDW